MRNWIRTQNGWRKTGMTHLQDFACGAMCLRDVFVVKGTRKIKIEDASDEEIGSPYTDLKGVAGYVPFGLMNRRHHNSMWKE